jgi:hypothetical protein
MDRTDGATTTSRGMGVRGGLEGAQVRQNGGVAEGKKDDVGADHIGGAVSIGRSKGPQKGGGLEGWLVGL